MKNLFALAIAAVLAGCGQEAPPVLMATASSQVDAKTAGIGIGDATFSIVPGTFRTCDAKDGSVVAVAKWNVVDKGIDGVRIYVEAPRNPRKAWLEGAGKGESTTGKWVFDQSKFSLIDKNTGKLIAELTVKAVPCK